ncbi:MAG: phosphatase PAP2 family protein [Ignavibacteria bacterium CG2_30_36_16]|nr:MAG: phosphatase PAP2 family protein [Ignavibacteria bacterium CG2_30_36_16]PJB01927.1 MAG: phosphatase PAP2 family protein [Ignavibacteria bacterium CG_4_9_14_3_um_filter_36_18]
MAEFLYSIDVTIFYFFNHTLSVGFLDKFFSIITNVNNWYIAYIILLGILLTKGGRQGRIAAAAVVLMIVVTDQLQHKVIKEIFERIRPCNALTDVLTPLGCNGTFSFPSNHATNNFAVAVLFYRIYPHLKLPLFIAASLIAISRVYLGLHYPSDILSGVLVGSAFGYIFSVAAIKVNIWMEKREQIERSKK